MKIRIAGTVKNSIVDGPGIRFTVFAQGCPFRCGDCHNPHTHDFNGGELADIEKIAADIKKDPFLDGVTFSGGEPFEQAEAFAELADLIDGLGLNIMCYTGYTYEELVREPRNVILLSKIDTLIDGRFDAKLKSMELKFRGSRNQRFINAKESVKCGKIIETHI